MKQQFELDLALAKVDIKDLRYRISVLTIGIMLIIVVLGFIL